MNAVLHIRSLTRTTALAALFLLGAVAAARPAAAQQARGQGGGDEISAAERRLFETRAAQLHQQLELLVRRYEDDPRLLGALRRVDTVLHAATLQRLVDSKALSNLQHELARACCDAARDPELRRLTTQLTSLQLQLLSLEQARTPAPTGYLGVTFSGSTHRLTKKGEVYLTHTEYPAIISVEPGSPAAAGGIRPGDTLLAYGSHDVVRDGALSLTRLLKPGARVELRLRRAGNTRSVPVTVGTRRDVVRYRIAEPEEYAFQWDPMPPGVAPVPSTPRAEIVRVVPAPRMRGEAPTPPVPSDPGSIIYSASSATAIVAGAELARMSEDLRELFGTERGVLVLNVANGSPAAQAGLRGGDVIVKVDGEAVRMPGAIRLALIRAQAEDERSLKLEVVRRKATKTVTLAW